MEYFLLVGVNWGDGEGDYAKNTPPPPTVMCMKVVSTV